MASTVHDTAFASVLKQKMKMASNSPAAGGMPWLLNSVPLPLCRGATVQPTPLRLSWRSTVNVAAASHRSG